MRQRPWIFYGWIIVACAVLVMALASGTRMSFGIAFVPLTQQFGWTRTSLSTIVLITGIVTGLLQMIMGVLVDRWGPRRIMGMGVLLLGLGVWLLTAATQLWHFGLAYGVLVGIGLAGTQQVVMSTLIANWFWQHRGLAQSMLSSAAAVGWMCVVPVNMFIERTYDWTTMYRAMGTILLMVTVPLILVFIRNRPEDVGLQPLGDTSASTPATTGSRAPSGMPLRQAVRTSGTWKLVYLGFA
jgi:sugar phosphate permease